MKSLLSALLALTLISTLHAKTYEIPSDEPLVTVDIPESWEPEEEEGELTFESPDDIVTMFMEITDGKEVKELVEANVEWLTKDQGVVIDPKSQKEGEFKAGDFNMKRISWDGKSKEYGDAVVGFLFAEVNDEQIIALTYWITKKDFDKQAAAVEKIFNSLKKK